MIDHLAADLEVEPAALAAVLEVESAGQAIGSSGRPIIRFEAHVFVRRHAQGASHYRHDAAKPWRGQQWRPYLEDPWRDVHTGAQADEWAAYCHAATLAPQAATESISIGSPQIMGFHWARLGYPSPMAMLEAFRSEPEQHRALALFIRADPRLHAALQALDWRTFARAYNGPGQVDIYAGRLQAAYHRRTT